MKIKPADRIANVKPYFFSTLNKKIDQLQKQDVDVIRLDMGSPDLPPAPFIIEAMVDSARKPDKHGYTQSGGSPVFKNAVANYYDYRFDVRLDPDTEVVGLIGSKEGIFNIPQVLLNPGDLVLAPDPCYPVYRAGATIANCEVFHLPLVKENDFLPDLDTIPLEVAQKAKLMWLNYPNNPTGAVASLGFFEKLIEFAKKNGIIIAHDAPYVDVTYDRYKAPSLLQVDGAIDVVIEFNSLSKAYNMAGWRLGMAVGNPDIIRLLNVYKSQIDSSHFGPIMDAGAEALNGDQSWIEERNQVYQERRDIIVESLWEAGFKLEKPKAALYVWARLPIGHGDTVELCARLLEETGVSITPGIVYGSSGKDYVRISIVTPTARIKEATDRMLAWFKKEKE
ncbi:MAG: aminotransferase class I/II-fold pyridoxal phosphate-dependent enzyme [Chloroflexota bacterium]